MESVKQQVALANAQEILQVKMKKKKSERILTTSILFFFTYSMKVSPFPFHVLHFVRDKNGHSLVFLLKMCPAIKS